MKPYELRVCLSVASVDLSNDGKIKFLVASDDLDLPTETLHGGQRSGDVANEIFKTLFGSDAAPWVVLRQVGFFEVTDKNLAIVLYGAMIPEPSALRDPKAFWIDADELIKNPFSYGLAATVANHTRGF